MGASSSSLTRNSRRFVSSTVEIQQHNLCQWRSNLHTQSGNSRVPVGTLSTALIQEKCYLSRRHHYLNMALRRTRCLHLSSNASTVAALNHRVSLNDTSGTEATSENNSKVVDRNALETIAESLINQPVGTLDSTEINQIEGVLKAYQSRSVSNESEAHLVETLLRRFIRECVEGGNLLANPTTQTLNLVSLNVSFHPAFIDS